MAHKIIIRNLTRAQIVARMKAAQVTQRSIAEDLGVTQAWVSRTIARRGVVRPSEKSEEIFDEIERRCNGVVTR